jgi:mannose/cellobiose epimerase-like protein (N-acyl-D-glucosamine 2-epimerase family)
MTATSDFFAEASRLYRDANAGTLLWMLDRPALAGAFLNSKLNSITLKDYSGDDGLRGPDYTYGWIQGRGLEAIVTHAAFFAQREPALAARLDAAGQTLYAKLEALQRPSGHAFFCYDKDERPIYPNGLADGLPQRKPDHIYTYSDAFVAKGLISAAIRYGTGDLTEHLAYFDRVIEAIEEGRFQMDERQPLCDEALASQPDDIGPRMILLGAAGLLNRLGLEAHTAYADRFISHVIERHLDSESGMLRNAPGDDACNVGHGIEFVGFAVDYLAENADGALVGTLEHILVSSFNAGFVGPGIALSVSIASGQPLSPYCPWWSLPETIRSAALVHARTGSAESLAVWQKAHAAFFGTYWRGEPPIAYQTMTKDGPVDFVPATPDLDPGYHTGLSLLAAIHAADNLLAASKHTQTSR